MRGDTRWPGGGTHVVAVIGDPVRHSLSPVLHNAAFAALGLDWVYVAHEVAPADLAAAVAGARALGLMGLSVTMPHKSDIAAHLDRLSPAAAALGAVNTVVRRGRELVGENTDGAGFLDTLRQDEGFEPEGKRCVVFGAGGAARAVVHALATAGAAQIVIVNRSEARAQAAAALGDGRASVGTAESAADADLVVNATPVGMFRSEPEPTPIRRLRAGSDDHGGTSHTDGDEVDAGGAGGTGDIDQPAAAASRPADDQDAHALPFDPALLGPGQLVADLVYHPPVTPLLHEARARGAATANGLGMLVHQASHAFRLWTSSEPPLEVMSAAVMAVLVDHRDLH